MHFFALSVTTSLKFRVRLYRVETFHTAWAISDRPGSLRASRDVPTCATSTDRAADDAFLFSAHLVWGRERGARPRFRAKHVDDVVASKSEDGALRLCVNEFSCLPANRRRARDARPALR